MLSSTKQHYPVYLPFLFDHSGVFVHVIETGEHLLVWGTLNPLMRRDPMEILLMITSELRMISINIRGIFCPSLHDFSRIVSGRCEH